MSIEDVTERINNELKNDMSEKERRAKIQELSKLIESEKTEENHYDATVKSFLAVMISMF